VAELERSLSFPTLAAGAFDRRVRVATKIAHRNARLPAAFRHVLGRIGVAAPEALLFERPGWRNIEAARSLGMPGGA
jgi:hypothetical protein